jgi:hypothetical protein
LLSGKLTLEINSLIELSRDFFLFLTVGWHFKALDNFKIHDKFSSGEKEGKSQQIDTVN